MKTYAFYGTHTLLSDDDGEILLKTGQVVELDEARAQRHIEAGAPLTEVPEVTEVTEKENHADVSPVE